MNAEQRQNQALIDAMDAAGLTGRALADQIGTTPQAVSRWRTDDGALPHRRVRALVAKALNVPLQSLWPESSDGSQAISTVREWPAFFGVPVATWEELVRSAEKQLDICSAVSQYLATTLEESLSVVRARAEIGDPVRVRILSADPDGELVKWREAEESAVDPTAGESGWYSEFTRRGLNTWAEALDGVDGVEIRTTDDRSLFSNAVFRFDERMVTYAYTKAHRTPDEPAMLLARNDVGGFFDSLAGHVDRLWETGIPYTRS